MTGAVVAFVVIVADEDGCCYCGFSLSPKIILKRLICFSHAIILAHFVRKPYATLRIYVSVNIFPERPEILCNQLYVNQLLH